jgi:hypothetical protein
VTSMNWWIRDPSQLLVQMNDEFIEGPLRVLLSGACLKIQIDIEPLPPELQARAGDLAERYVSALARSFGTGDFVVFADQEQANLPLHVHQNLAMAGMGAGAGNREHLRRTADEKRDILRNARLHVTSYDWPLRACYDYMRVALDKDKDFFPSIYKMLETMQHACGGRSRLKGETGLETEITFLATHANAEPLNERHAPRNAVPPQPLDGAERTKAHDFAQRLLRQFEEFCRRTGAAGNWK